MRESSDRDEPCVSHARKQIDAEHLVAGTVESLGRLDIFVYNPGTIVDSLTENMSESHLREVLEPTPINVFNYYETLLKTRKQRDVVGLRRYLLSDSETKRKSPMRQSS